ncbi:PAS domain S-box protein [Nocardioides pacificus]
MAETSQRYRSLFEYNPQAVFSLDLEGRFTAANPASERMSGYAEDELCAMQFAEIIPEDHLEKVMVAFLRVLDQEPQDLETQIVHRTGHRISLRLHGLPIVVDGDVVGVYGIASDVTEHLQLQNDLDLTWAAVATAMDGISIVDAEHRIVYINDARVRMHGFEHGGELIGQDFSVLNGSDQAPWPESFAHDPHGRWQGEVTGRRRDGTTFPLETSVSRLPGGEVISIARDITSRRAAEEKLRRSEERHRTILAEIAEGYFEVDLFGNMTFLNRSLTTLFGGPADSLIGTNHRAYTHPDSLEKVHHHFSEVLRTGQTEPGFDWEFVRPDGGQGFVSTSVSLVRDDDGEPVGFRGISRDVTERMLGMKALRRSEERHRLITRATREVIWDTDLRDGRTTWWGATDAMFGLPEDGIEIDNDWWVDRIHPDERDHVVKSLKDLYVSPEDMWTAEYRFRALDEHEVNVFARGYVVRDEAGRAVRCVGSMMDISDRKESERQLREARRAAEEASQAKSLFLANMSHEIRTPLTSVLGGTELLLDTDLAPIQSRLAGAIDRSGRRLLALVNDILDFSKIEAGMADLDRIEYDVRGVVRDAAALLERTAADKGLSFEISVSDAVPARAWGDPARLAQVLTNLLSNAVKFTDAGHVRLRADLAPATRADTDEPALRFVVEDTGIGISDRQLPRLFQSFSQADGSITRKYGGTGLGLAISKQLVELMDGTIGVRSRSGLGSTFTVLIPVRVP